MTTINEAVSMFLLAKQNAKARKTTIWYEDCLAKLVQYLGAETDIAQITAHRIRLWLDERSKKRKENGKKLSVWTLHGYGRSARALFRWLVREELLQNNPFEHIELVPLPKNPRRGIKDEHRDAMLKAAQDHPRDLAILRLAAASGARRNGIASLKMADLDLKTRRALVCEKGNKSRYIFFDQTTAETLKKWLQVRDRWIKGETERVFGLDSEAIYRIFRKTARKAGVQSGWNPHNWRHAFARHYLKNGGDISKLSQLLGHSDIKVTHDHYGGLDVDELHDSYDEFAPEF